MDAERTQAAADRLAAKLDGLDLDDDERLVLGSVLAAGADSVEPVDSEVEGFALNGYLHLGGTKQGQIGGSTPGPQVSVSLSFTQVKWTYTEQRPQGY